MNNKYVYKITKAIAIVIIEVTVKITTGGATTLYFKN